MNCWRFDARIFEACREVTRLVRGEFELPGAVALAARRGVRFKGIPPRGPCSISRGAPTPPTSSGAWRAWTRGHDGVGARGIARRAGARSRGARREGVAVRSGARRVSRSHRGRARARLVGAGRLEVFGKHTDYAGGRTLVCAVPTGFAVTAGPRADGTIRVIDARRGDRIVLQPRDETTFTGWRHYVAVAARRLAANFPGAPLGADIVLCSDLPRAWG